MLIKLEFSQRIF